MINSKEGGYVTLVITMVILFIVTAIGLMTAKMLVTEQQASINQIRYREAMSAAEAGLEAALKAYARVLSTDFGWCMVRIDEWELPAASAKHMQQQRSILEKEGRASPAVAARLVQLAQALRRLTDHDLEETASTRLLVMAARLASAGMGLRQACRAAVVDALSDDLDTVLALDEVVRAVVGDED